MSSTQPAGRPASGAAAAFAFSIDPASSVPPFRQLHDAVIAAVREHTLMPGERLPTVRALATELGLAVNTVAASYKALEAAGIVEGRGRAGTFVKLGDDPVEAKARQLALEAATALTELGITNERSLELFADAVRATRG